MIAMVSESLISGQKRAPVASKEIRIPPSDEEVAYEDGEIQDEERSAKDDDERSSSSGSSSSASVGISVT